MDRLRIRAQLCHEVAELLPLRQALHGNLRLPCAGFLRTIPGGRRNHRPGVIQETIAGHTQQRVVRPRVQVAATRRSQRRQHGAKLALRDGIKQVEPAILDRRVDSR